MDMSFPPMQGRMAGEAGAHTSVPADAGIPNGDGTPTTFLLAGGGPDAHAWLAGALSHLGVVEQTPDPADIGAVVQRVGAMGPGIVFVHFRPRQALACTCLGQQLAQRFPELPLVALADAPQPELMLAALRAGVKDFVDMREPGAAASVAQRLLLAREHAGPARGGKVLALLGARPGVGVTTLALRLTAAAHARAQARTEQRHDALLLDLGLPARDGALYANVAPGFHFVDAVRNLRRFDPVFVQTALTRHDSGFALLPLPPSLTELRDIAMAEALSLLDTLRGHFDLQVIDLGGFSNLDVMAQLARAADQVLLVADQSVGAIVSAAELIEEMRRRDASPERMQLVVSRMQARAGIDAGHIAQRLALPLAGTLPDCRETLLAATNAGTLLAGRDADDPYALAVGALLESLGLAPNAMAAPARWPVRLKAALRAALQEAMPAWQAAGGAGQPARDTRRQHTFAAMVRRLTHRYGQVER